MSARKVVLAITPGDPDGVGPEVVWKSLCSSKARSKWKEHALLCVGSRKPFDALGADIIEVKAREGGLLDLTPPRRSKPFVWLLPAPTRAPKGKHLPGFQSGWSIQTATRIVQSGGAAALVTGPISKERLQRGGYPYVGHTDFLADLCGVDENFTMMLANDQLRISLVTTHLALKDVPQALSRQKIRRAVLQTAAFLRKDCGITRPKIAVAALNPHAGEGGILGNEEVDTIDPEVRSLRKTARGQFSILGPLPSDTLFANHVMALRDGRLNDCFDAVVCMYHDQGLIPVKMLDFPRTVNLTLGLPLTRTSVDHGTAFDIAGLGIADPSSFESAVDLAICIVKNRGKVK